jgi:hypothetical protein
MIATAYRIEARKRTNSLATASINDFLLIPDKEQVEIDILLASPHVTPYCIDLFGKGMVLVGVPEEVDLSTHPFVYEAQYRLAKRIYTIGLDDFNAASDQLPVPAHALLLHSTGRCGSTLLTRALNAIDGVSAFSEPDIFTQLAMSGRLSDGVTRDAFVRLYRNCLKMFCRGSAGLFVLKFRSVVCEHADYLAAALPAAKSLFLYRNALDVAASTARIMKRSLSGWQLSERERRVWSLMTPLLATLDPAVDAYDLLASFWAGPVLRYLHLHEAMPWLGAMRYEELVSDGLGAVRAVLAGCGIHAGNLRALEQVFETDSQAESHLSIDGRLVDLALEAELADPQFERRLRQSFARIDPGLHENMVLPGTFTQFSGNTGHDFAGTL